MGSSQETRKKLLFNDGWCVSVCKKLQALMDDAHVCLTIQQNIIQPNTPKNEREQLVCRVKIEKLAFIYFCDNLAVRANQNLTVFILSQ